MAVLEKTGLLPGEKPEEVDGNATDISLHTQRNKPVSSKKKFLYRLYKTFSFNIEKMLSNILFCNNLGFLKDKFEVGENFK